MHLPPIFAVAVLLAAGAGAARPDITKLFRPSLSPTAGIYLATDANYTRQVTQRWTKHAAPSFIATIKPATVGDVQNIVKIAALHKIPFLATGGGHGVSLQMASLRDGLQIDLSNFDSVRFAPATELLSVGGGAKFSQVVEPLFGRGYQFPLGTAACVGVLGATLGAGVSANQGQLGLLIDLLEEVQLVTATGELITASRTQNKDLFWALRGAGANFGIAVQAIFRVPRAPTPGGRVTNANYLFSGRQSRELWRHLESLDGDGDRDGEHNSPMPRELALNIAAAYNPQMGDVAVVVNVNFAGTPEQARPHLEAFKAMGPLQAEVLHVPWPDVFRTAYFGIPDTKACGRNQHVNMRSVGTRRTDPDIIMEFLAQLERLHKAERPVVAQTAMVVHRFSSPPKTESRAEDARAADLDGGVYPHRGIKMHIQLESEAANGKGDAATDAFLDEARANFTRSSGFEEQAVYVNFAHGDEGPSVWYGAVNIERLAKLKREWDPDNLFGFYNAVPTNSVPKYETWGQPGEL